MPLLNLDSIKKELTVASVKDRATKLNDQYRSAPTSSSSSYGRTAGASSTASGRTLPPTASSTSAGGRVAVASAPVPLPPRRTTGPIARQQPEQLEPQQDDVAQAGYHQRSPLIDWQNISQQDKHALFSALDQVFSGGHAPASALRVDSHADVVAPIAAPQLKQTVATHHTPSSVDASQSPPPPPPPMWARPSSTSVQNTATMSYPPACTGTSHAADIASFFSSSQARSWSSAWFVADSPLPPPLQNRADMTWSSSWQQYGNAKTLIGTALFCDLSVAWWRVQWDVQEEQTRGFAQSGRVRREARYLDGPAPLAAEQLWDACSTYGLQVAQFAESAERGGVPIARGECWDLASEALAGIQGLPPPVPAIARTHGHLLFSGSATGKDFRTQQTGHWRGGDTCVRRGDIVEWRTVRLRTERGWADLGNPDHTALIVGTYLSTEQGANAEPKDGQAIAPWEVGVLEVIEQSKGKAPSRATYDLKDMEKGEVWIYRPVGMQVYTGIDGLKPDWDHQTSRGRILVVS